MINPATPVPHLHLKFHAFVMYYLLIPLKTAACPLPKRPGVRGKSATLNLELGAGGWVASG